MDQIIFYIWTMDYATAVKIIILFHPDKGMEQENKYKLK